jgi:calcium/calmodulin-dependent protein kinase (CaM kinase) II
MADSTTDELLRLNQRLLDCITQGDWKTYEELCDPSLTCIEPEAPGQVVEGLTFHKFNFELGGVRGRHQTTMTAPHVRILGDVAILVYVRLVQKVGDSGAAVTVATAETRIWQRRDGKWRHVHFHRSPVGN